MSSIIFILLGLAVLVLALRYPAECWLLLVIITLQRYFHLANLDQVVLIPVVSGISISFSDLVSISGMLLLLFRFRSLDISSQLKKLLLLVLISVVIVGMFSFFVLDASLGTVGNRFRSYAIYFLIPAVLIVVRDEKRFRFFIGSLVVIAVALTILQVAEYARGQLFVFSGLGEASGHYTEGGVYESVRRVFYRAPPTLLFVSTLSVICALLDKKKRLLCSVIAAVCGVAIALSLTRTVYIYGIFSIVFSGMLAFSRQGGGAMKGMAVATVVIIMVMAGISMTGDDAITGAVGERFGSIAPALLDEGSHSTVDDRRAQFEGIMNYIEKSNIPPILGVGITDMSVLFVTSDLGYINIILNMGLLGLIIILGWIYYLIRMSYRLWKASTEMSHMVLSGSILASMPGILFTGINFDYFTGRYFFWLLVATVVLEVVRRQIDRRDGEVKKPLRSSAMRHERILRVSTGNKSR